MCTLSHAVKDVTSFTGYKVVIKVGKHIYSPSSGIEYTPGPVRVPKRRGRYVSCRMGNPLRNGGHPCYNRRFTGYTAVFESIDNARKFMYVVNYTLDLPIGTSYEIVRMTISGDLRSGSTNLFYGWDVIAGKHIDKIERIK